MMQLKFEALLPVEQTDFAELWEKIRHTGVKGGAKARQYLITYDGELYSGLDALMEIVKCSGCKVTLST